MRKHDERKAAEIVNRLNYVTRRCEGCARSSIAHCCRCGLTEITIFAGTGPPDLYLRTICLISQACRYVNECVRGLRCNPLNDSRVRWSGSAGVQRCSDCAELSVCFCLFVPLLALYALFY